MHTAGSLRATVRRQLLLVAAALGGLLAAAALLTVMAAPVTAAPHGPAAASYEYPGASPCDTTLQACLDGADPGSTVVITSGTYVTSLTLSKAVSLTGVASDTVLLQALPGQRVLTVTGAAISTTVIISGLTFSGGDVAGGTSCPEACGGALLLTAAARPQLINLLISENSAYMGGGLYADLGSPLVAHSVQFRANTAVSHGGGVNAQDTVNLTSALFVDNHCGVGGGCYGGGLYTDQTLSVTDTQFLSNTSQADGGGALAGGVVAAVDSLFESNTSGGLGGGLVTWASVTLTNTDFISNAAEFSGGGVYVFGSSTLSGGSLDHNQAGGSGGALAAQGNISLSGTRFTRNTSQGSGGAVALDYGLLAMTGVLFEANRCLMEGCVGGGVYAVGWLTAAESSFISNTASGDGGGLYAIGSTLAPDASSNRSMSLEAVAFRHNSATGSGGGAYHANGSGYLTNTLFAGNTAQVSGAALHLASANAVSVLHVTIAAPGTLFTAAVHITNGVVGITNTLFANYAIGIQRAGGSVSEDYNLFSSVPTSAAGGVASGGHSLTGAAAFADLAGGDYHLTGASLAINAGTASGVDIDFEGDDRPLGLGPDIGFDEYVFSVLPRVFLPLVAR